MPTNKKKVKSNFFLFDMTTLSPPNFGIFFFGCFSYKHSPISKKYFFKGNLMVPKITNTCLTLLINSTKNTKKMLFVNISSIIVTLVSRKTNSKF